MILCFSYTRQVYLNRLLIIYVTSVYRKLRKGMAENASLASRSDLFSILAFLDAGLPENCDVSKDGILDCNLFTCKSIIFLNIFTDSHGGSLHAACG